MIVCFYIIYANHFDRTGMKATISKIFFSLFLQQSPVNTIAHI